MNTATPSFLIGYFFFFPAVIWGTGKILGKLPLVGGPISWATKKLLWLYFLPITWPLHKLWRGMSGTAKKSPKAAWRGFIIVVRRLFAAAWRGVKIVFAGL